MLCESILHVLVEEGVLSKAKAIEAIETVAEHDISSRATTAMSLGLVRAAQGKDAEAEAQLLHALSLVESTGFRGLEVWILTRLEEFLRSRDRNEEADAYAERRAELAPAPALGDAFARRIERIA